MRQEHVCELRCFIHPHNLTRSQCALSGVNSFIFTRFIWNGNNNNKKIKAKNGRYTSNGIAFKDCKNSLLLYFQTKSHLNESKYIPFTSIISSSHSIKSDSLDPWVDVFFYFLSSVKRENGAASTMHFQSFYADKLWFSFIENSRRTPFRYNYDIKIAMLGSLINIFTPFN